MSRLPSALQPLWPVVKRGHRYGARALGGVARHTVGPRAGLPLSGTTTARELLAAEPATTSLRVVDERRVVRREAPAGEPAGHWYFADRLVQTVPEQFVLELRGGRVLGRHAAVVSARGRLEAETSHYFDIHGWREHPVFWNPAPAPPTHVAGTVALLAARGTGHNYYHFVVDALPRIGMLEQAHPGLVPDAWIVDTATRYQRELLELVGLGAGSGHRLLAPAPSTTWEAERLLVGSLPNASTLVAPATVRWLRERLPARRTQGLPELLYVTRGTTPRTRRVVHEEALREQLVARGFQVVDPGALSVQDQIDHFAAARVVVAPHGAALTNLVFARPGVRVLELFAPGYLNGGYWSITSAIEDSRYRYLVADGPRATRPGAVPRGVMDDIDLPPERVLAALDALLG